MAPRLDLQPAGNSLPLAEAQLEARAVPGAGHDLLLSEMKRKPESPAYVLTNPSRHEWMGGM